MRKRFIWEAEDDNPNQTGAPVNANADGGDNTVDNTDTADTGDNNGNDADTGNDDANTDDQNQNTDDNNTDDNNNDQQDSEDDFSIDANDNASDDTDGTDQSDDMGSSSDGGTDDSNSDEQQQKDNENDQSVESEIKAKEKAIFASLSPAEQRIKNKKLKNQFKELYDNCANIIDQINDINADINNVSPQLKRVITILYELKDMIFDYVIDLYDSKGYIENDSTYKTYLVMLNEIRKILRVIDKSYQPSNYDGPEVGDDMKDDSDDFTLNDKEAKSDSESDKDEKESEE